MSGEIVNRVINFVRKAQGQLADPTRDWPTVSIAGLEFDTASGRLNGVALDEPISAAMALGRADSCSGGAQDFELDYRAVGLQVEAYEGTLTSFRIIVDPARRDSDRDRAFQPGILTLRVGGRSLRLTRDTTETDLIAALGSPIETGPIAGDRVHTFVLERSVVDTYHDPATGRLQELELGLRDESAEAAGGESGA